MTVDTSKRIRIKTRLFLVDKIIDILEHKLDLLIDVKHIFNQGTLLQKRELIKMLFHNNLYYRDGLFLTKSIVESFKYNLEAMKSRGFYII
jgi:site-specific DNA recombinase